MKVNWAGVFWTMLFVVMLMVSVLYLTGCAHQERTVFDNGDILVPAKGWWENQ